MKLVIEGAATPPMTGQMLFRALYRHCSARVPRMGHVRCSWAVLSPELCTYTSLRMIP